MTSRFGRPGSTTKKLEGEVANRYKRPLLACSNRYGVFLGVAAAAGFGRQNDGSGSDICLVG